MVSTLGSCSKLKERNDAILAHAREFDVWARRLARRGFEYDDARSELIASILSNFPHGVSNMGAVIGYRCKITAFHMLRDSGREKRGKWADTVDAWEVDVPSDESFQDSMLMRRSMAIAEDIGGRSFDIYMRHYVNDEDMKDIAESYGISKSAMTYSHNKLKKAMREGLQ